MKIFSVKKTPRHKDYYLFGLRILRKSGYSSREIYDEIVDVFDYIRASTDISSMPPARGLLRQRQLGMLRILRTVARFCEEHKIKYWLDFGTLLGAVRHKGFIPWDDDADIGMMRDDYEKFIDLFNAETPDENLQAEWYSGGGIYNMIKIRHKKVPNIWVDIFPCDFGYKKLTLDEAIAYSCEIQTYIHKNTKKLKHMKDPIKVREFFAQKQQTLEFVGNAQGASPQMVFRGIEFLMQRECNIFDYDMFFPLKTMTFEGYKFPVLNKPELYLTYIYRDYMSLPNKISVHNDSSTFNLRNILALEEYIKAEK